MKLAKKLSIWEEQKLISNEQREKILRYEESAAKPRFLSIMTGLAVLCIGLGLIALIAANWQEIPATVKLGADFILLFLASAGIYRSAENSLRREGLILALALLILGSIGLIGQTYQLQPEGMRAYLLWGMLTLPLLSFSKKAALPAVWLPVTVISAIDQLQRAEWAKKLMDQIDEGMYAGLTLYLLLSLSIIYALLKPRKLPALTKAYGFWLGALAVASTVFLDLFSFDWYYRLMPTSASMPISGEVYGFYILGLALLAAIQKHYRQGYLLSGMMLIFLIFSLGAALLVPHKLWGLVLSLSLLGLAMFYSRKNCDIRLLNFFSALAAIRIFIIYLQVFGSLLTTGSGLIISGIVLLIIIRLWQRFRPQMTICEGDKQHD